MRFHIGLSISWKTIKKWIIPIFLGILTYFGLSHFGYIQVYAASDTTISVFETSMPSSEYFHVESSTLDFYDSGAPIVTPLSSMSIGFKQVMPIQSGEEYIINLNFKLKIMCSDVTTGCGFTASNQSSLGLGNIPRYNNRIGNMITYSSRSWTRDSYGVDVYETNEYLPYYYFTYSLIIRFVATENSNFIQFNLPFRLDFNVSNYYLAVDEYSFAYDVDPSSNSDIILNDNKNTDKIINEQEKTNDKLDETNDNLNDIEDSITNPNIDSGTGNDFFDNFNTEDNGGISGIITAPLTLINSLLDGQGTCTDLTFPIMGKEVSIPSGCIIWDKVPNEMEVLIQTLVCGTGAYFLLRQLFKDIEKLKNPNNSEVSTLDL